MPDQDYRSRGRRREEDEEEWNAARHPLIIDLFKRLGLLDDDDRPRFSALAAPAHERVKDEKRRDRYLAPVVITILTGFTGALVTLVVAILRGYLPWP